ncbi:MAG: thiamine phosphate synthase [Deltaproteobacteria bacterium]|nr:thiamine phosphate synthase [Deltaproteobacteria bacterium]
MKDFDARLELMLVASLEEAGPRNVSELAGLAFAGGVGCLQLREKNLSGREFYLLAATLAKFCRERGKLFLVNDRLDVALASGADGVHLGQGDLPAAAARRLLGPDKILGVSVANLPEAEKALADGADYLGVGAMYATGSKTDARIVDFGEARKINLLPLPSLAIGGVDAARAEKIWGLGFSGLAVISALTKARDPAATARELLAARGGRT